MIYLDTHAVVWLYAGEAERFTSRGRELIEQNDLLISPVVQLELQMLREIGRIAAPPTLIVDSLEKTVGLAVCDLPFAQVILEAIPLDWTRDPFDRVIVAQAHARQAPLLTKDRLLRQHCDVALW